MAGTGNAGARTCFMTVTGSASAGTAQILPGLGGRQAQDKRRIGYQQAQLRPGPLREGLGIVVQAPHSALGS
jgi:hypothetical protein